MKKRKTKKKPIYKRSTIFRRYFAFAASIVLGCMVVLGLVMIIFVSSQWWNDKTDTLVGNARNIISVAKEYHLADSSEAEHTKKLLSNTLNTMSSATKSDYFITDENGNILVCENSINGFCAEHDKMKLDDSYMSRALKNGFTDFISDDTFGRGKFVVAVPIIDDNSREENSIGAVFAVENAIEGLLPYILGILNVFFFTAIILLGISSITIYQLCKGIAVPLEEMEEVTKHFAKNLSTEPTRIISAAISVLLPRR